ncbi:response regulator [Microvirga calopogonii]|uniref:response regulator n=1 Tax=Microvirga calopogonii TaxID=2078013 RepID=UPI000E0D7766|nr:response regulator [Microvirga calopogonii]
MADHSLRDCHILVVEDEYYLATELEQELSKAGAAVIGPVPSVKAAVGLIERTPSLDGAVLDVNLGGDQVFPVADKLVVQGVPFLFVTGYNEKGIPASYGHVLRLEKPTEPRAVVRALAQMLKAT